MFNETLLFVTPFGLLSRQAHGRDAARSGQRSSRPCVPMRKTGRVLFQPHTMSHQGKGIYVDVSVSPEIEDTSEVDVLAREIEADAQKLLAIALRGGDAELSVLLCSDSRMLELNQRWRNIPKSTDVLSFPQEDEVVLGDVVVSVETARRQAAERSYPLLSEMRILLVHGLLHLLGYDHETSEEDLEEMASAEARLLSQLEWEGMGLIYSSSAVMH